MLVALTKLINTSLQPLSCCRLCAQVASRLRAGRLKGVLDLPVDRAADASTQVRFIVGASKLGPWPCLAAQAQCPVPRQHCAVVEELNVVNGVEAALNLASSPLGIDGQLRTTAWQFPVVCPPHTSSQMVRAVRMLISRQQAMVRQGCQVLSLSASQVAPVNQILAGT
jgi:hypothetical protein